MLQEIDKSEIQAANEIEIIGHGPVGAKALQLILKTPTLREVGLQTPRRIVWSQGFLNEFFLRNGLGGSLMDVRAGKDVEARIINGSLTRTQFEALAGICALFAPTPLAIRSSAEGDARGTGTYLTEFAESKPPFARKAMQRVLASYFSRSAAEFRRDTACAEGFGIIIEPMIGQELGGWYAPIISGYGYTSTLRGPGFICAVPGLGGGVTAKDGETIYEADIAQCDGVLGEYLAGQRYDTEHYHGSALMKPGAKLVDRFGWAFPLQSTGMLRFRKGEVVRNSGLPIANFLDDLNMLPLFRAMRTIEERFGQPQYIEWAATVAGPRPSFWLTQIADVNKKVDFFEFGPGEVIFWCYQVVGTGERRCKKTVLCRNRGELDNLRRFNLANKDYALVFSSCLVSSVVSGKMGGLMKYADFSHASVLIEKCDLPHSAPPGAHLPSQVEETGKLYGVLDQRGGLLPNWSALERAGITECGLFVYPRAVKVVASERHDRLAVYAEE